MAEMNEPTTDTKQVKTDKQPPRLPFNLPTWTARFLIAIILLGGSCLFFFTQVWPRIPRYTGSYRIEIRVNPIDDTPMVLVPAGEFEMGSEDGEADERPVHTVYLDAYWIYQTEVTNRMYALCVAAQGCTSPSKDYLADAEEAADYPVVFIPWEAAATYCTWAGGRLPTEAEWEKAARGEDGRTYPWGEGINARLVNNKTLDHYAAPNYQKAGSYRFAIGPYGTVDLAGNVQEWVADYYAADYYANSPTENPQGPEKGGYHVVRGSSWLNRDLRAANRFNIAPGATYRYLGFRCVVPEEP